MPRVDRAHRAYAEIHRNHLCVHGAMVCPDCDLRAIENEIRAAEREVWEEAAKFLQDAGCNEEERTVLYGVALSLLARAEALR